jgi:hypothetical protein
MRVEARWNCLSAGAPMIGTKSRSSNAHYAPKIIRCRTSLIDWQSSTDRRCMATFPHPRTAASLHWKNIAQACSRFLNHQPPKWEWQVTFNGETVANGFERKKLAARFEGNRAMFLLLAADASAFASPLLVRMHPLLSSSGCTRFAARGLRTDGGAMRYFCSALFGCMFGGVPP